jgi:hypothetical protein
MPKLCSCPAVVRKPPRDQSKIVREWWDRKRKADVDLSVEKSRLMKEVESLREEKDCLLRDVQVLRASYHQSLQTLETLASSLEDAIDENLFLSSSLDMIKKTKFNCSGRNGRT